MFLPIELAPIAMNYAGPGCVIYPHRLDPPSTHERMQELVEGGWLTKTVRAFDRHNDEELEVEQDPDDGTWWSEGEQVPETLISISYLTTKKVHDTTEARTSILTGRMARVAATLGELLEEAKGLEPGGLDKAFAMRCELAMLALNTPVSKGTLDYYLSKWRSE